MGKKILDEEGNEVEDFYDEKPDGSINVPLRKKDNWAHRSKGMLCKTCMFNVPKIVGDLPQRLGRCRRHAPTMSGFPAVFETDWCGDHKLCETKINDTD